MRPAALELERYVLYAPIAAGGMATVYFARQRGAAGFSKAVAIKRMRPDLVHEREFVDLFLDEARLTSRLRHANIVSVIDVVASGDELLLVMEYLHGESLARLVHEATVNGGRVPPPIAIAIVIGVLHGLHAAHEATDDVGEPLGIVHRDVSPQNVIVGVDGIARVADFGIARAAGQIHATDDGKTRGKARYSAPEQLRGTGVSRRSDIFSASVVLWEMLVGRALFDGESQGAVVTSVLTEPIVAPGVSVPELPPALDDVIMRSLDRDPKRRHATALELATALERALSPAGPGAVGEWVQSLVRTSLVEREAIVRTIQAGGDTPVTPGSVRANPAARELATEEVVTRPLSPPDQTPSSKSRRRVPILIASAAGAIAIGAAISSLTPKRDAAQADPPGAAAQSPTPLRSTPSGPAPATSESIPAPEAALELVTPKSASPEPNARPTAKLPAAPSPPRVRPGAAHPKTNETHPPVVRPPASTPVRAKANRCDPPYDLDSSGRKIFRVDCL